MTSFRTGDVVIVDYPHVETNQITRRPALVISSRPVGPDGLVFWGIMITAAVNRGWPGDINIDHYHQYGLPIPSVIRTAKITTLETTGAERIGQVDPELLAEVRQVLVGNLGL